LSLFDTEGYLIDTWDAHGFTGQGIYSNNMGWQADRYCIQLFYQEFNVSAPVIKVYNNTCFGNLSGNVSSTATSVGGEINNQGPGDFTWPWITSIYNNIGKSNYTTWGGVGGNGSVYSLLMGGPYPNFTIGGTGKENIFKGQAGACGACTGSVCDGGNNVIACNSGSFGTNTYVDPTFTNTADLLSNWVGTPTCTGFVNVTRCMGWNAVSRIKTSATPISDLTPTAGGTSTKGYQLPTTTCNTNTDYPTWLKGIVYLHWDGTNVWQYRDLVTVPCGL
jgi:hypothetical protein